MIVEWMQYNIVGTTCSEEFRHCIMEHWPTSFLVFQAFSHRKAFSDVLCVTCLVVSTFTTVSVQLPCVSPGLLWFSRWGNSQSLAFMLLCLQKCSEHLLSSLLFYFYLSSHLDWDFMSSCMTRWERQCNQINSCITTPTQTFLISMSIT